ncbi:MAG TPA: S41 family peptidase [Candidatus Tripitaka sp. YC43]
MESIIILPMVAFGKNSTLNLAGSMRRTGFMVSTVYCLVLTAYCLLPIPVQAGGQPWEMTREESASGGLRFRLTNTVFAHIKDYYIDFHNLAAVEVLGDALRGIEGMAPNLKIDVREKEVLVQLGGSIKTFDTVGIKNWLVLRELLKEILTFVESGGSATDNKGNCPLSTPELEYAALNGILNSFDPYSRLYRPEDLERIKNLGSGSFMGLGMEVEFKEGFLTVTYLHKDSPAHEAGLQLGDRIVEIEGESTKNMGLTEALGRMSGPQGTSITLSVWRPAVSNLPIKKQGHSHQSGRAAADEGGQILSFTLKIERIEPEPAEWALLEGGRATSDSRGDAPNDGLGYIKLKGFQEGAFYSMVKAIRGLEEVGGLKGLVLDLRNNYGGVMEEIINVADLFLPDGIITIKTRTGEVMPEFVTARPSGRVEEACPIVVLMDGGSASGAEILSATLRDNGRALLVGEQTFGKACIQQVFRLHGRHTLKLTTAKYFTPGGEYINLRGLTPDVLLVPIKVAGAASGGPTSRDKTTLARRARYAHSDNGDGTTHPTPTVLCYLEREEAAGPPPPVEYASGSKAAPIGGFQKDFQIQLAKNLLKAILSDDDRAPLEVIKKYQAEEDRRIVKTLESRKIDWSTGATEGIPVSVASLAIDKEEVEAGDTVTLTLSVENRGEYPLFRVLAEGISGNPALNGLEFPMGKVEPGKKVSHSLKIKVPDDSLDRHDEIALRFSEDNGFPPADIVDWVTIWAHPTPLFAYSCQLPRVQAVSASDVPAKKTGKETELLLKVKNVGHGVSHRNVVELKGDEEAGVTVLKGRQELGVLKPGEEREVKFAFTFTPPGGGTLPTTTRPLRLLITDLLLGAQLSARLPLQTQYPVGTGQEERGTEEVSGLPPSIILQNAVLLAGEGFVELSFTARDDHHPEGAYVLVNERKVFFGHNPEPTPEHTFTTSLPITRGPNLVRIVAYDDQGLSTEKAFVITGR